MWILALALCGTAVPSVADTVVLRNKPPFRHVKITDYRNDQLVFRGVSQQFLRKPLAEVERFAIEGHPALNAAEEAAADKRWHAAATAYERALAQVREPWVRKLIHVRQLVACDRAGEFGRAIRTLVDVARRDPSAVTRYTPDQPGPPGSVANREARAALEKALAGELAPPTDQALRTLLLEVLLCDDVEPLPSGFEPPAASQPSPTTAPSRRPTLGILPEPADEAQPLRVKTPAVRLSADSLVLRAARAAIAAAEYQRAARLLQRGLPYVTKEDRPAWLLLQYRCQIDLGQPAQAASQLLRIAETDAVPPRATLALYYAGVAHERLDRPDVAETLYREILQRSDAPDEVEALARTGLARVKH